MGHEVERAAPGSVSHACLVRPTRRSASRCCPTDELARRRRNFDPDAVHIATEGPLGMAARRWCRRRADHSRPLTTRSSRSTSARACRFRWRLPTRICAGSMARPPTRWWRPLDAAPTGSTRNSAIWRSGAAAWTPSCSARAASGYSTCRARSGSTSAGRGRKGHRGLPRTATCRAANSSSATDLRPRQLRAALSAARSSRVIATARNWRAMCLRRRVRVPEPHRHLRSRAARGDGLRCTRGGVSGDRAVRCGARRRDRCA